VPLISPDDLASMEDKTTGGRGFESLLAHEENPIFKSLKIEPIRIRNSILFRMRTTKPLISITPSQNPKIIKLTSQLTRRGVKTWKGSKLHMLCEFINRWGIVGWTNKELVQALPISVNASKLHRDISKSPLFFASKRYVTFTSNTNEKIYALHPMFLGEIFLLILKEKHPLAYEFYMEFRNSPRVYTKSDLLDFWGLEPYDVEHGVNLLVKWGLIQTHSEKGYPTMYYATALDRKIVKEEIERIKQHYDKLRTTNADRGLEFQEAVRRMFKGLFAENKVSVVVEEIKFNKLRRLKHSDHVRYMDVELRCRLKLDDYTLPATFKIPIECKNELVTKSTAVIKHKLDCKELYDYCLPIVIGREFSDTAFKASSDYHVPLIREKEIRHLIERYSNLFKK